MVAKVVLGNFVVGLAAWVGHWLFGQGPYDFRLGQRGLWIDNQFYHWRRLLAVTHYVELHTLLIKVHRADDIPIAIQVDLSTPRLRNLPPNQIRDYFGDHVINLDWKSV